jgi:hypothetical protein
MDPVEILFGLILLLIVPVFQDGDEEINRFLGNLEPLTTHHLQHILNWLGGMSHF